ncbi:MAG TPA: prepilin-type N-terminal cleavage/methylation domain-containing protein [Pirellulales bacterium]|jgi:prepilin-type N-terminal cleavage/methylation domain-containing protein|nr:prepilin-type N-terminal cleavage/methylation domain-containing protein [Pirellulales bacterium]
MIQHQKISASARRALTLLELVVVLAILAALATIAIQATTRVGDQSRFETTQQTLSSIQKAVLGDPNQTTTDASAALRSFVADVGRPPTSLNELAANGNNLLPFSVVLEDSIAVPTGWRGPYVNLPVGATAFKDGWGNAFIETTLSAAYPYLATVTSYGSDNTLDGSATTADAYTRDLAVSFDPTQYRGLLIHCSVYSLDTSGNKVPAPASTPVIISYYGPDPATPAMNGVLRQVLQFTSLDGTFTIFDSTINARNGTTVATDPQHIGADLTVGPRALRANVGGTVDGAGNVTGGVFTSPVYLNVLPGATMNVNLQYTPISGSGSSGSGSSGSGSSGSGSGGSGSGGSGGTGSSGM